MIKDDDEIVLVHFETGKILHASERYFSYNTGFLEVNLVDPTLENINNATWSVKITN